MVDHLLGGEPLELKTSEQLMTLSRCSQCCDQETKLKSTGDSWTESLLDPSPSLPEAHGLWEANWVQFHHYSQKQAEILRKLKVQAHQNCPLPCCKATDARCFDVINTIRSGLCMSTLLTSDSRQTDIFEVDIFFLFLLIFVLLIDCSYFYISVNIVSSFSFLLLFSSCFYFFLFPFPPIFFMSFPNFA